MLEILFAGEGSPRKAHLMFTHFKCEKAFLMQEGGLIESDKPCKRSIDAARALLPNENSKRVPPVPAPMAMLLLYCILYNMK